MDATGYNGAVMIFGNLSGNDAQLDLRRLISSKIDIRGFWLQDRYCTAAPEEIRTALGTLIPLITSGQPVTKIVSCFPLEEIKQAVLWALESGRDGKVRLTSQTQ